VTIHGAPLTLDKRVRTPGPFKVGDTVRYSYTVTNTSNTALHNVRVRDDHIARVTCPSTTLASGQNMTCRGSYTITRADSRKCRTAKKALAQAHGGRKSCRITNTATASGTDPTGLRSVSGPARATITVKKHHHSRRNITTGTGTATP
jgi:hypothetical protein